jgi:ribonuclease E
MLDDHADTSATSEPTGEAGAPRDPAGSAEPAKRAPRKRTTKKAASAGEGNPAAGQATDTPADGSVDKPAKKTAKKATKTAGAKKVTAKKATTTGAAKKSATQKTAAAAGAEGAQGAQGGDTPEAERQPRKRAAKKSTAGATADTSAGTEPSGVAVAAPLFQAPEPVAAPARRSRKKAAAADATDPESATASRDQGRDRDQDHGRDQGDDETPGQRGESADGDDSGDSPARRKRRRGGRRRRKAGDGQAEQDDDGEAQEQSSGDSATEPAGEGESTSSRRRRRRRRSGEDDGDSGDDPANTVVRVRSSRSAADEITAVSGSTRLEAKKQRRREGREAGRRRAPIVSEAEFLARRESVNRVMVIRQHDDITQIAVLEDSVLVEHYVARESQTSLIGNVYLGRVQNVLPSMEAAFIDIGKGRNAVLYAGEVNWSALGHKDGQPRKIESVLSSGQPVLVQVTKDPIGHKGARLTSQVSLAGRFLVYVPDGTTSGISRKLPDTERNRLKTLLKEIVPEHAGVIVRTAAEGASEEELTRDVERLTSRWDDIDKKAANKAGAPQLLYGEPDLTLKVVRDLFTEDFAKLVIEGDEAWDTVQAYVEHVAPDLGDRLERYEAKNGQGAFAAYRVDEQIKKGLDRKVWLPSGGSLIIDRTEAMTVVDVNTGKFTGSGGNLEETVTKNNLEAAEEIVRQLRLRDIGGIIVVDFIDMVLESNRDLVLRRLVECLGRDRTRHQVAEVTSLGLVQMTRKRIGTGLLESFSHDCPHCHGRGVIVEDAPVEPRKSEDEPRRGRRGRARGRGDDDTEGSRPSAPSLSAPSPKDIAAMARHHEEHPDDDELESLAAADVDMDSDLETDMEVEPETVPETEPETVPETEPETVPEQVDEPQMSEPEPEPAPPVEPEKPRVVTRTRRRSASRPAGPPSVAADAASAPVDGGAEAPEPAADETPALHVPVKRKGRKR